MLTCQCTRGVSPGGESVLICQVPSAPSNLEPGIYNFTSQSDDGTLSGRQLRFEWTGSEWKRRSVQGVTERDTKGDWNSALKSWLNKPFVISKKDKKSSFFSTKPVLTSQLIINKRGFVPREDLKFETSIKNVDTLKNHVTQLKISLCQKLTCFNRQEGRKTTKENLIDKILPSGGMQREIFWAGKIQIPGDIMPSLTSERKIPGSVEVSYYLQFSVQLADGKEIEGQATIVIGRGNSLLREDQPIESEPPAYNSLHLSRRSSVESLPPTYDEAIELERLGKWQV